MDEDSPLLTPEPDKTSHGAGRVGHQQEERLLTPERERDLLLTPELERAAPGKEEQVSGNGGAPKRKVGVAFPLEEQPSGGGGLVTTAPSAEKYRKIKKVGVGAYGSVFMAENTETNDIVAVKVTSRKEDPLLGGFPVSLLREISILRTLKHENIVQLHEMAQTSSGDPLIVMEYCQSSLLELLNSRKHDLSFSEVKYIIRQVLDATRHMHERGILHRDLATKNVLFNLSGEIKVCDFGISRFAFGQDEEFGFVSAKNLENPNMIVSLPYRAVELLLGQANYGPALDVWAAGCILGEILLCQGGVRRTFFGGDPDSPNKTPQMTVEEIFTILGKPTEQTWPGLTRLPLLKQFQSNSSKLERLKEHSTVGCNEERNFLRRFFNAGAGKAANTKYSLTEACFDLMGSLLTLCPASRQTAEEALKHSFFSEKPMPEWHAWHWALASSEIPRGDDMRRQEKDAGDVSRALLRKLSSTVETSSTGEPRPPEKQKSVKELAKEGWEKRAAEKKLQEERRRAAEAKARKAQEDKRLAAQSGVVGSGGRSSIAPKSGGEAGEAQDKMPPGWSKHWSSSKQRYYYHDSRSGRNQWYEPSGGKK
eukprot:TRINITY_DN23827_c0_g3_i1.p1 TRINITY_DN23827_c0_g3~~TRINITY_DN23827_c0_g3_i1.p1  ORF type:complete len:594 (+),score=145.97 TRINITY_DN23827_c0_g3_i1:384-2165(+)